MCVPFMCVSACVYIRCVWGDAFGVFERKSLFCEYVRVCIC